MSKTYAIARDDGKVFSRTEYSPELSGVEYIFVDRGNNQAAEYARKDVATEEANHMPWHCTVVRS